MSLSLEIAANSVASAIAAQTGGADRVELCSALELGGLTPSYAQIALTRERLQIPLYVLIRPRSGDFLYTDEEVETMLGDIETCVTLGCDGVVLGALNARGDIDVARCRPLITAAKHLGVTFHRAIDLTRDPLRALEDVISLGCERVLSSGGKVTAMEGAMQLRQMQQRAAGRIAVMPGAGINPDNVVALQAYTGATQFHASAKALRHSAMQFPGDSALGMSEGEMRTDVEQVRRLAAALASIGSRGDPKTQL